MTESSRDSSKRSLFALIADLPNLLITLVKGELEQLKNEITGKLKQAGIGAGLLAGAAFFAFFAFAVLLAAAVAGIAAAGLPVWASALIIGGGLLLIAVILVAIGITFIKRGVPPTPDNTIESVKQDVRTIKGIVK